MIFSKLLLLWMVTVGLAVGGCLKNPVQQGNILKDKQDAAIAVGDTRFRVETLLGTPVLNDILHPNQAVYVESYEDEATGELNNRHLTIVYDQSLRVQSIDRTVLGATTPH